MSVKKSDSEYTDAKGNLHKHFANGRSEIYIGGYEKDTAYVEITDAADEAVNRKRWLRYVAPPIPETVQHNDPEIATRDGENEGVPGIDLLDPNSDEI